MSIDAFADALTDLDAEFADAEPLTYTCNGRGAVTISAPWTEHELLDGGRQITYEVSYAARLPQPPSTRDSFIHRGRSWSVQDVKRRDVLARWELTVADLGAAA